MSLLLSAAQSPTGIVFNKNFEGGSLGKIEQLSDAHFRCSVEGQYDEHGHNRQANWYYFRMDGVRGRELAVTLTDLVGEYNGKPGACPMTPDTIPVFSEDGEHWQHFANMDWDEQKKEATVRFHAVSDSIWIAHVPPYTHSRLVRLLEELDRSPCVRIEVIGKTVQGRDLHLITITDFDSPDQGKKTVWLQARQHAWETGTSYVMEGALRFIVSDDSQARALRQKVVFKFTPMMDPDGCASGKVRFNANGYDVNRHWNQVDLRNKEWLRRMPEIWYVKKALFDYVDSGHSIDLMLNMHNTETNEYIDTQASRGPEFERMSRFFNSLAAKSTFDPRDKLRVTDTPPDTTNCLWKERQISVMSMEQRIGTGLKLARRLDALDRFDFGKQLISILAEACLTTESGP
jgi:hypothetical protein